MLLTVIKYGFVAWVCVALARVFFGHSWATHWVAVKKFVFIWVVSTSPVLCAALLSSPHGAQPKSEFDATVYSAFSLGEQFVYAATFTAPLMYLFFEAVIIAMNAPGPDKIEHIRQRLRGIGSLLLPTLILLVVTALSFAAARNDQFHSTFLFIFLGPQSFIIYALSLGIWYASVLADTPPNMDFAELTRNQTKRFTDQFKDRIRRGAQDG
jgi:hypothetical protein